MKIPIEDLTDVILVYIDISETFCNSGDRPGGGDGVLDLDSGIFTCLTPGFYEVSFSAYGEVGPTDENQQSLYLYKNDNRVDGSYWTWFFGSSQTEYVGVIGSRILVSNNLEICKQT